MLGVCLQIVDGGPKGFGVVFTLSGGRRLGHRRVHPVGHVRTDHRHLEDRFGLVQRLEFWIGLGFKINLFWIFSFGAEINLKLTYLGKHPWYVTLHAEIKIDTPWFLPDITLHRRQDLAGAAAVRHARRSPRSLSPAAGDRPDGAEARPRCSRRAGRRARRREFPLHVQPADGVQGIAHRRRIRRDDIPIVSVDSTIAIDFTQPVSNDTLIATTTYDGRHGRPACRRCRTSRALRAGSPSRSAARRGSGRPPGSGRTSSPPRDTTFSDRRRARRSTLTFAWDADSRADGKLAPKRLLVNSSAPYSFATAAPQNDEEAARNDADYPCCDARAERQLVPKPHVLDFASIRFGARVPRMRAVHRRKRRLVALDLDEDPGRGPRRSGLTPVAHGRVSCRAASVVVGQPTCRSRRRSPA